MSFRRRATTDLGTVVLHWVLVACFLAAALSGLRIASDEPGLRWIAILDAVLPVERVWLIHLGAAVGLTATVVAYWTYIGRSRLLPRVSLGAIQLANLFAPGRMRWAALGSLVLWGLMLALALEIATGLGLLAGFGGGSLGLHLLGAWICLGLPLLHVACHWAYGRGEQLLRVLRPAALVVPMPPPDFAELLAQHLSQSSSEGRADGVRPVVLGDKKARRRPLLWAVLAGLVAAGVLTGLEPMSRQSLTVVRVAPAAVPRLDGDVSDPAWAHAPVTRVLTEHGANFGGTGESTVEMRAVHDGSTIYFAFTWTDPTRSLKHLPLVKHADGWHLVQTAHDHADEDRFFEDKFAVLITRPVLPLIGAAIHLSAKPLTDMPGSLTGRGLHYLAKGGLADVWQWHADHANIIDDGFFSGPAEPTAQQMAQQARYSGGFTAERGPARYSDNFEPSGPGGLTRVLRPRRLPKDVQATALALGRISNNPDVSETETARWWMAADESVSYSEEADREIPINTVIPGVIVLKPKPGASGITGAARWSAGRWTLTLARKLKPPTPADVPIETGTMMWLAAFDHSETRHTRHLRPIVLELQNADPS